VSNPLHRQREEQRFAHGLDYVSQAAPGPKRLSVSELAHLNQMLTAAEDPWRFEPAMVKIPSGRALNFNVVNNPLAVARDVIGEAQLRAGNGDVADGALYLYSQLVLNHLFTDANRRTAMLATVWLVQAAGREIDGQRLATAAIGDLRDQADLEKLRAFLAGLIF